MKILFIHGIGFHEATSQLQSWIPQWVAAITSSAKSTSGITLDIANPFGQDGGPSGLDGDFSKDPGVLYYERLVKSAGPPSAADYVMGVSSLLASAVTTTIGGLFGRDRSLADDLEDLRWKAEEVIGWAQNDKLRASLRQRVQEEVESKNPDIIVAHSYGTLITYDTCLFSAPDLLKDRYFITLGSQIGNPLLRKEFNGLQMPVRCRHWFNLYNPGDKVFVSSLQHIRADNFTQILTPHKVGLGHDGATYLAHTNFAAQAWPFILQDMKARSIGPAERALREPKPAAAKVPAEPRRAMNRALLVGINEYADPSIPTLGGCVNDTFQLSATLQETGIDHRDIRLLHNKNATRQQLLDNIGWLLDDAQPGDNRVLSFSGHGHRRPTYALNGAPLEMHEILCTHDYVPADGSTGLRDADFQSLYASLPSAVHFMIFLDCCHSGGVTRDGGPAIRSFSGPADMEHESSKWNDELEMWEQGSLLHTQLNPKFLPKDHHSKSLAEFWQELNRIKAREGREKQAHRAVSELTSEELHLRELSLYYGANGDTRRIGRATPLRDLPHSRYDQNETLLRQLHPEYFASQAENGLGAKGGPYLPLVFMACGESEKASEYLHGAVSYGAFTYALTLTLRDIKHKRIPPLNYGTLLVETARKLSTLGYTQTPDILGPPDQLYAPTPFSGGPQAKPRPKPKRKAVP